MSKDNDIIVFTGKVIECMPGATFRIKLEENDHILLGFISGRIRKHNINILLHDRVDVEVSPYDINKGRIVYRHKR